MKTRVVRKSYDRVSLTSPLLLGLVIFLQELEAINNIPNNEIAIIFVMFEPIKIIRSIFTNELPTNITSYYHLKEHLIIKDIYS